MRYAYLCDAPIGTRSSRSTPTTSSGSSPARWPSASRENLRCGSVWSNPPCLARTASVVHPRPTGLRRTRCAISWPTMSFASAEDARPRPRRWRTRSWRSTRRSDGGARTKVRTCSSSGRATAHGGSAVSSSSATTPTTRCSRHDPRARARRALVTGAGQGIGRGSRSSSPREATRSSSTMSTRPAPSTPWASSEAGGGHAVVGLADVTDPVLVESMVERATSEVGAVDVLVNNAGRRPPSAPWGPFADTTIETHREFVALNLLSAFICSRAVLDGMLDADTGRSCVSPPSRRSWARRVGAPTPLPRPASSVSSHRSRRRWCRGA